MTPAVPFLPRRGDIVWLEFDPVIGHEQGGYRPAIVISPDAYNRATGLAIVCPITRHAKGFEHEVPLPTGLPVSGVVLCDHVKSVDCLGRQTNLLKRVANSDTVEKLGLVNS